MRALPGRNSRTSLAEPPSSLTRETSALAQRERIRRATGELVAKKGYADVTVEQIVKRARVSFKTFYGHYGNKEQAFLDLFDTALATTDSHVRGALSAEPGPWPQQVALALRTFFGEIRAEPLIARACLVEGPTLGPVILQRYGQAAKAFVPLLRSGRRFAPEAAELPESLEDTLAGAILWTAYHCLALNELERVEALVPETIEFVLRPYLGSEGATWAGATEDVAAA